MADLIRFDFTNDDGRPDSKMITHDEMRERYAAFSALQSRLDAAEDFGNRAESERDLARIELEAARRQLSERDAKLLEARNQLQLHAEEAKHPGQYQLIAEIDALLSSAEPVKVHQGRSQISVPRELLIRAVQADASIGASAVTLVNGWKAMAELRQIIADTPRECVVHDWAFDEGPRSCGNVCIKCGLPEPAKGGDGEVMS